MPVRCGIATASAAGPQDVPLPEGAVKVMDSINTPDPWPLWFGTSHQWQVRSSPCAGRCSLHSPAPQVGVDFLYRSLPDALHGAR